MKKFLIPSLTLFLATSLLSCSDDDKHPATEMFSDNIATLIIPGDESANASAQMVQYSFENNFDTDQAKLAISGLSYNGIDYQFKAENIPFSYQDYYNGRIENFSLAAMTNLNGGTAATILTAMKAILRNFRPSLLAPMQAFKRQYVINITVGNEFKAKTFDANGAYFGTTMSSYIYNNQHKDFTTDKPVYCVSMNLTTGKADVTIYNPVFAAEMPPSMASTMMLLEGLSIAYTKNSFRLVGVNITAEGREGGVVGRRTRVVGESRKAPFSPPTLISISTTSPSAPTPTTYAQLRSASRLPANMMPLHLSPPTWHATALQTNNTTPSGHIIKRFESASSTDDTLSNLYSVRLIGLEPTRLSTPDPKSGAATITPRAPFCVAKIQKIFYSHTFTPPLQLNLTLSQRKKRILATKNSSNQASHWPYH